MEGQDKLSISEERQRRVEADLQDVRQRVQDLAENLRDEQLKQQTALGRVERQMMELRALMESRPCGEGLANDGLMRPAVEQYDAEEISRGFPNDLAASAQEDMLQKQVQTLRREVDVVARTMNLGGLPPLQEGAQMTEAPAESWVSGLRTEVLGAVRAEQEAFRDRYLSDATNCAESVKNLELTMDTVSRELNKLLQRVGGEDGGTSPNRVTFDGILCNSNKTTLQGASFEGRDDASPTASPGRESTATALGGLESAATCAPMELAGVAQWCASRPSPYAAAPISPQVQLNLVQDMPARCAAPALPPQYAAAQPTNMWRRSVGHPSVPTATPPPPSAPMYFRSRSHEGPAPASNLQDRVVIATSTKTTTSPMMPQERTMVAKPMQPSAARAVATPQQGVQDPFKSARDVKPVSRATIAVPFSRDWKGQAMPQLLNVAMCPNGMPARPTPLVRLSQVPTQTRVV